MVSKERICDLYHDVICKCYCSVEVPSRVIEMVKRDGCTRLDALRTVMIDRIHEAEKMGLLKNISPEEIQAVADDLKLSTYNTRTENGSKNLRRLEDHFRDKPDNFFFLAIRVPSERKEEWATHVLLRHTFSGSLARQIILEWLDNHKNEVKVNG